MQLCSGLLRLLEQVWGENGFVARYSGKEFAIILPEYDIYSAKNLTENICRQVKNINAKTDNYALKMLTLSCGICAIPYTASTMDELIYNADMAVYHVKHTGKNAIMIYSAGEVENQNSGGGSGKERLQGQRLLRVCVYDLCPDCSHRHKGPLYLQPF